MNVVDSSGWLEYFSGSQNASFFRDAIQDSENLVVPTVSIYEVFKRVLQQRNEDEALEAVNIMMEGHVVDLSAEIALEAAKLSSELRIPMADSMILATAQAHGALLWTQDSDFADIDVQEVRYIGK